MSTLLSEMILVGIACFPALTSCLTWKFPDASEDDSSLPDKVAWFHPPKLGTSFGNVLAHAANTSLPECARISECGVNPSTPQDKNYSLDHPFAPHRCIKPTDGFMLRYPPATWFRSTKWLNEGWDWGEHWQVDAHTFSTFSWYGLFRPPHLQLSSNYFRLLDNLLVQDPNVRESRTVECRDFLGVTTEDLPELRNFANGSAGLTTFYKYIQSRQGFVTKMLAGVGDPLIGTAGCPGPHPAKPRKSDVAIALKRLHGFRFVGLTDDWERSVCLFHRMHGDRPCKPAEFSNNRKTSTNTDAQFDTLFATLSTQYGFIDEADQMLFEAARERFERDVKLWGVNKASCARLKCTSQLQKRCS